MDDGNPRVLGGPYWVAPTYWKHINWALAKIGLLLGKGHVCVYMFPGLERQPQPTNKCRCNLPSRAHELLSVCFMVGLNSMQVQGHHSTAGAH